MKTPRLPLSLFAALSAGFLFAAPVFGGDAANAQKPEEPRPIAIPLERVIELEEIRSHEPGNGASLPPVPMAFDGNASDLKATVVVPTLDTPIENGKNAIWCASIPLLWKYAENNLQKGPLTLEGNPPEVARLNDAHDPTKDIRPEDFYVNAGFVRDGIKDCIHSTMSDRFPAVRIPDFFKADKPDAIIGYAYMKATVKGKVPYVRQHIGWSTSDGKGKQPQFYSFGVLGWTLMQDLRDEPSILYVSWDVLCNGHAGDAAILLGSNNGRDRIVVAFMDHKASLAKMLASVKRKILWGYSPFHIRKFRFEDSLNIPTLNWNIVRHCTELENRTVQNGTLSGKTITEALQQITFTVDETGAIPESVAQFITYTDAGGNYARQFDFNRPFLLYMTKPGASEPYFVMWVANTELLTVDKEATAAAGTAK